MKIGVYGHIGHKGARAVVAGFQAIGHKAVICTAKYFDGETEDFGLVVVVGEHSGHKVAKAYKAIGAPVLTMDWGYFKRVNSRDEHGTGHWQVGVGGLNRLPEFACPPDRFEALGIAVAERGGNPDGYVLVCGQVPGDAAHGLGYEGYTSWLRDVLSRYPDAVYRPHPAGAPLFSYPRTDTGPLADALAGARQVVTYNSNVGHDALLAGVPVIAEGRAAYAELCGEELPSLADRLAYFHRAAHGQWTVAEMETGEPQRFWLDHLLPGVPLTEAPGAGALADNVSGEGAQAADLTDMTVTELRQLAGARGVKIPAGTNKAGIIELLRGAA